MWMIDYRAAAWRYWLATACALTVGVSGVPSGFLAAMAITVVQLLHFGLRDGGIRSFPVQVRMAYLGLLLLAWPDPLRPIYWIPTIGTWAQVLFGYCLMARLVSLLAWNRVEPFSMALVQRTLFSAPVRGNILQGLPALDCEDASPGH